MWKISEKTTAVCNPYTAVVTQATVSHYRMHMSSLSQTKQIFKMPNLYYRIIPGDRGGDICAAVVVLSAQKRNISSITFRLINMMITRKKILKH